MSHNRNFNQVTTMQITDTKEATKGTEQSLSITQGRNYKNY